jgi:Cytochrome P460
MLRDSLDRRTCDGNLFFVLLVASGLASSLACGLGDDAGDDDAAAQTDVNALEPGTPGGPTPNGLAVPAGVQDWLPIGAAARSDNVTLRVIVGNATAVAAARSGQTNPWPEGTMLSHLVWDAEKNANDPAGNTVGPGAFNQVTLMVKDSDKYAADGGWAYGVWMGPELTPPSAADFDRACVNCHTDRVADKDYVFTDPGQLPDATTMGAIADAPNGVQFPSNILDWRVIGIADIISPMGPTIRVLVGNPTAVSAARSGQTNPWPDGSRISHIQWNAGENPDIGAIAVVPVGFRAFTVMQRSAAAYGPDGNWAYGAWPMNAMTGAIAPPAAADFDRNCVGCHTGEVQDRDMVFTEMAQFPDAMLTGGAVAR